jgi:starch synthase
MVLLAHPGTQYSLYLARELERCEQLTGFHTCLAVSAKSILARVIQPVASALGVERQWQNRLLRGVPPRKLHCYPLLEIEALWRSRKNGSARRILRERNERFQKKIPDRAITNTDTIIGFDTSSQILATRARAQGKTFILDRSSAHPRSVAAIIETLKDRFPEWVNAYEKKTEEEFAREEDEHRLAHIIVVPSTFVANMLVEHGIAREKIRVNPFGTDTQSFRPAAQEARPVSPLIFLFVGALTAGKGLPLLLQAWRQINAANAELWIVGPGRVPDKDRRDSPASVRWLGPASRKELPALFQRSHVFVFPSFFEGLAQVQVEAAACGLPIIATNASGGEDIIEEGTTGFIIEAGNLDQLNERINQFIERPQLAGAMGECARAKAGQWSWSSYGERWRRILQETI